MKSIEYLVWRKQLMQVTLGSDGNALYPLLHFVLEDLPTSTRAPELDDRNTQAVLECGGVIPHSMEKLIALYLAYLVQVGFLSAPKTAGPQKLPVVDQKVTKAIGRHNK